MFIMLDGIDGSGKSTIIKIWKEHLASAGNAIFDLAEYWKANGRYPEYSELKSYDFIISSEPTYSEMGLVIRNELIKKGTDYPPLAVAEAYSLDRLILYSKIIIPALRDKKCVIQDRGISTSLAYQPSMTKSLTTAIISKLPGNKLALRHAPNHLILIDIPAEEALKRLTHRVAKQDNVIFERLAFQKKLARVFRSSKYRSLFIKHKTKIYYLRGEEKIDIIKNKATNLLKMIIKN